MRILALESWAKTASAALLTDGVLTAEAYQNCGLTHSVTLLPMVEAMLKQANVTLEQIDCFAVAYGPGSFTGVRIGVSAVKGLAWAAATAASMAWGEVLSGSYSTVMELDSRFTLTSVTPSTLRTALSYLTNQVRAGDAQGALSLTSFGGGDALQRTESDSDGFS